MPKTTLLIARHGNTFNAGDVVTRVGARTDLPLVESGLLQGRALGQYLKDNNLVPDIIFTSTMQRTIQMAEQVRDVVGVDIPTRSIETFNEIDYGPDENIAEDKVVARIGVDALKAWEENSIPPDGWIVDPQGLRDAWLGFGANVAKNFSGMTVLMITHNGIARFSSVLTENSAKKPDAEKLKLGTGALGHLQYDGTMWQCLEWNIKPAKV